MATILLLSIAFTMEVKNFAISFYTLRQGRALQTGGPDPPVGREGV